MLVIYQLGISIPWCMSHVMEKDDSAGGVVVTSTGKVELAQWLPEASHDKYGGPRGVSQ